MRVFGHRAPRLPGETIPLGAAPSRREAGASLIELVVSLSLITVIGLIFYESYIGSMRAGQFLESHGDLARCGQKATNVLRDEIVQSRRLFQNDADGAAYLAALQLPAGVEPQPDARLPLIDVNGELAPDGTGQTRVGNLLLLARQLTPLSAGVDLNGDGTIDPVRIMVDEYQFRYFFLARDRSRSLAGLGYWLDLLETDSQTVADYYQLNGLSSQAKRQAAQALYAAGVRLAWDPSQSFDSAFYVIDAAGGLTGPVHGQTLPMGPVQSLLAQLHGGRVSGRMVYSVGAKAVPPIASPDPIYVYAQPNGEFPGGFEVLVVGPAGARKSVLRLMLLSSYADKINSEVSFVVATANQL